MENFSENKRKRGRPPEEISSGLTMKEILEVYDKKGLVNKNLSDRCKTNKFYQYYAQDILTEDKTRDYSFIIAAPTEFTKEVYKKTILQELGRLRYPELITLAAREICKNRLVTADATSYIRHFRCDKTSGSSFQLAHKIFNVISDYNIKYNDVDKELMIQALETVKYSITENFS